MTRSHGMPARSLARALHRRARRRLEKAEDEFVAGEVKRAAKVGLRSLPDLASGPRGGEPELILRHAGPEAFGRV